MKKYSLIVLLCCAGLVTPATGTLTDDDVTGNLSDPFTNQIYNNSTAIVGPGQEFTGFQSVSTQGNVLEHYADLDASTITVGVRHNGLTALIFNANPFTYEFGSLDWSGPGEIQGVELASAFENVLWPNSSDPNAKWIGWGQDAMVPPPWNPVWDPVERSVTVVATEGFTIPPGFDVWATFNLVVPEPTTSVLGLWTLASLGLSRWEAKSPSMTPGPVRFDGRMPCAPGPAFAPPPAVNACKKLRMVRGTALS